MDLIHKDYDLTPLTTFGIKAKAKYFAEYSSVEELRQILRTPEYQQNEALHIGGGSNLLFIGDFNGIVLRSAVKQRTVYRKDDTTAYLIAGAGEDWPELVDFSINEGLAGLENLAGIPGQAGASAIQNIGAYGVEAKDVIFKVECYDRFTHQIRNFTNEECCFGYRDSIFKHEYRGRFYVLRVCYKLTPSDQASNLVYGPLKSLSQRLGTMPTTRQVRDEVIAIRNSKLPDPAVLGSAGSFFKNPVVRRKYYEFEVLPKAPEIRVYDVDDTHVKLPAGWLIEQAGLKSVSIGDAEVYPKQALVIVNKKHATGESVKALAELVRKTVKQKFAVTLQPEVNFIDTAISVKFLGTGTSKGVPEPGCFCDVCESKDMRDKRLRSSVLLRTHGLTILVDATPDFRRQALDERLVDLDAVLLTHQHSDHVGGIDDLRAFSIQKNIPVFASQQVAADLRRRLDYCFTQTRYPGVPDISLHEIDDKPFYFSGLKIIPIKALHGSLPILGYRIGSFAYLTDVKTLPESEFEKLEKLDVLVLNALRPQQHFAHLTLQEALDLSAKINPKTTYLTHICHQMGRLADVEPTLPPNVHLAYDGLSIKID